MRVISGAARGTTLHSIENLSTRPTLDRVKESLFNIISEKINEDTVALDLFSGSGAIGIEFLSRGAKEVVLCDNMKNAVNMINQNLKKTRLESKAKVISEDYVKALKYLKIENYMFDIIYLDPPYKEDLAVKAIDYIDKLGLLKEDGIIIIETDEKDRDVEEIDNISVKYKIFDIRKYGRAYLIFLDERGK